MRKAIIYLVCASLVMLPMRRADAFVAPAAVPVILTAGGPVAWGVAAIVALVAAGTAIHGYKWPSQTSGDALDLRINPKAPARVPSGWTAPALPGADPVPPATTAAVLNYYLTSGNFGFNGGYTTMLGVCQAYVASIANAQNTPHDAFVSSLPGCRWYDSYPASPTPPGSHALNGNNTAFLTQSVCPAGYTLQSGSCNLTNAPVVPYPSDNVGNKKVQNGTISDDPRDPDSATPAGVTVTPTQITVKQGTSTTTVKINGDGSTTTTVTTGNGNGTSTRTELKTGVPNSGAPDGGTNATAVKTEQVNGEGGTADTDPAIAGTCQGCALEATQLQVKAAVEAIKTDGVKIKEDEPAWTTQKSAATTAQTAATTAHNELETKFGQVPGSGLGALGVPGLGDFSAPSTPSHPGLTSLFITPSTCQPVVSSWGSKSISFDVCPVANFVKPILEWFLYGLTVLYVYGAFWRRPQGAG